MPEFPGGRDFQRAAAMLPEAPPTDPVAPCPTCGNSMSVDAGVAVCPQCAVGSLLAMDPLTGEEAPPPPIPKAEVFDDVVPGVDLIMIKGSGGMGTVLKGRQLSLDRDVAVKIIRRDRADDPAYEAALREEAGSMARLDHPGIVRVLDFGRTLGGNLYLLLEWVEGTTLRQLLERRGALSAEEAADLILPLCAALQHAHDHCVVHRDLKPENILLTTMGQPKLADFGLARLGGRAAGFAATGSKPSRTASTVGTPAYMAPEQAAGTMVVDRRADVYALALILQEMLTGKRPAARPVTGQASDVPPAAEDWRSLPASIPPGVRALLRRNLSNTIDERAESAQAFADDLRDALAPPAPPIPAATTATTATTASPTLSRRAWVATAGAFGLGLAVGSKWRREPALLEPVVEGYEDRPDPLQDPKLIAESAALEAPVIARQSPEVTLTPSLSLGPQLPLRPPLPAAAALEMDLPLEPGLDPSALALRVARFAEAHVRCYDSDAPRPPQLAEDGRIDIGNDESGFLNIGRAAGGKFKEQWSAYVKDYPHMYTQLLGAPTVRPLRPGRHEAVVVIWSRFGTGHRFGKLETTLNLEVGTVEGSPLTVHRIKKSESTIVPSNPDEVRLSLFKMGRLIFETLTPENSSFLPAFFERRHYYLGKTRRREDLEWLVAERNPEFERNRLRLVSGPEVYRHDAWLHSGVFLGEALRDLPEHGMSAGQSCLIFLSIHFEKIWPTIRSLAIRPLGTAAPAADDHTPPPSK